MKTLVLSVLAVLVMTLASSDASADPRVFTGNHKKFTNDCSKQPEVTVVGNHLTVTLKGTCAKLTVVGNHATVKGSATTVSVPGNHCQVDLDQTDEISLPGNNNQVTWKKSSAASGPSISNVGNKNKVTKI
ncbi:MAG TPA: DUF3060 domain-containing protein [Kofleriaceae bacterium]|nr:DUF3060 domain-containing protein [Kofleriaceae bacterium]